MVGSQFIHLLASHPTEAEHTDLVGDVLPRKGRTAFFEVLTQERSHFDDAIRHALHFLVPLRLERGIAENRGSDERTVHGWVRVHRTRDHLELRLDTVGFFLIFAHHAHGADALAVQAHVLREGLCERDLMSVFNKDSDRLRITFTIARGEALVRHVEEGEVILRLHDFGNFAPLLRRRIDASRIVRTRVQQEHASVRGVLDVFDHPFEIEPAR